MWERAILTPDIYVLTHPERTGRYLQLRLQQIKLFIGRGTGIFFVPVNVLVAHRWRRPFLVFRQPWDHPDVVLSHK